MFLYSPNADVRRARGVSVLYRHFRRRDAAVSPAAWMRNFDRGAENQAFLVESVTGVETLKAMAVEPQMQRRWEEQLAGYVAASFRVSAARQYREPTRPARQQTRDGWRSLLWRQAGHRR